MDKIDPKAAALVIQDMQNDVIIEGGAFADSGAPAHAIAQNAVENVKNLARFVQEYSDGSPRSESRKPKAGSRTS